MLEQREITHSGLRGDYIAMDAPDWVQVIAEVDGQFILVRQWRPGAEPASEAPEGEGPHLHVHHPRHVRGAPHLR